MVEAVALDRVGGQLASLIVEAQILSFSSQQWSPTCLLAARGWDRYLTCADRFQSLARKGMSQVGRQSPLRAGPDCATIVNRT